MSRTFPINVQEPSATLIKEGRKTIEGRLQKGKFLEIEVGDVLILNEDTKLEVIRKTGYKSFREMLEVEGYENAVPLARSIDEAVDVYYKIYSKEDEERMGVFAIKIKLIEEVQKPKVYLLCGLTGSGKSTWAEKFVLENPNTVHYKFDKFFIDKYGNGLHGDKHAEYEKIIKAEILEKMKVDIANKKDVILDFGFWKKAEREENKKLITDLGATPKLLYFKQPKEILLKRLEERNKLNLPHEHIIPKEWLDAFEKKFEEPGISEEFEII